ncbi:MAG: hypothetical protein C4523_04275 [Myxococcales bacterium]|nr:MAG: hypothetical protein C4523_04275 [Myxococcales bacterium]
MRYGLAAAILIVMAIMLIGACEEAQAPPNVRVAVFKGSAYERGYRHGEQFAADIRSLYTRLLDNALLPNLNLERSNIAPVLGRYYQPQYDNGQFSYQMMLESAQSLYDSGYIPDEYQDEMHGMADGSGIDFEKILVLNTFFDTTMGFRAVSLFIQSLQKPHIVELSFADEMETDGFDNNDNGEIDEAGDGRIEYHPSPYASILEVPADAKIRLVIRDEWLGGLSCVDAGNVDPIGERIVEARCVKDDCIAPECKGETLLKRECITGSQNLCLSPSISIDCIDRACAEELDPGCVDPESLRLRVDERLFVYADAADRRHFQLTVHPPEPDEDEADEPKYPHDKDCQGDYEFVFTPPDGLPAASAVAVVIQIQDQSHIYSPEPFHPRNMRDERFVFTTKGYAERTGGGSHFRDVANTGPPDGTQPPTFSFGLRDSATPSGEPLLAHHYILIDSDIMHEHALVAVHIPDSGIPHATFGWTGLLWGFSGINLDGLAVTINNSDTLDNPLVGGVVDSIFRHAGEILAAPDFSGLAKILDDVQLLASGRPMGFMMRELLAGSSDVEEGLSYLHSVSHTFGWNMLLADEKGDLAAAELDASTRTPFELGNPDYADRDGFFVYRPETDDPLNLDASGRPFASIGPDDLRMASHFMKNIPDMDPIVVFGPFSPKAQFEWSNYYPRSTRTFFTLGEKIRERYGEIDADEAFSIMRVSALVDPRDSMEAVVFEPKRRLAYYGMGLVPAPFAPIRTLDLQRMVDEGRAK